MSNNESPSSYRRMFRDVVKGYTKEESEELGLLYIKTLTTHDQVDLEEIEEKVFNKAKKKVFHPRKKELKI